MLSPALKLNTSNVLLGKWGEVQIKALSVELNRVSLVLANLNKYTELDTFLRGPDPGTNREGIEGRASFLPILILPFPSNSL